MMKTTMENAFERAGLSQLGNALLQFKKAGGTRDEAIAAVNRIYRVSGADHTKNIQKDQHVAVQTGKPFQRKGVTGDMANKAHHSIVPSSGPSPQVLNAMKSVAHKQALTVMDSYKIDGKSIGDWTVAQARVIGKTKSVHGYILREAAKKVANPKSFQTIRESVKIEEMQRIIQQAAELVHEH